MNKQQPLRLLYRGGNGKRGVPMKKEYQSPELTLVFISLRDIVMASGPENHSSYIDDEQDDWDGDD